AQALDRPVPEVGTTTFRPPYTPVTFGAFAGASRGKLLDPVRTTPMHGWAVARGAVFEDVGLWKRARYFPGHGEDMRAAVARECHAVGGRGRRVERGDAADVAARGCCLRPPAPAVPPLVHRGAGLRARRGVRLRRGRVGGLDRARPGLRHHALRHRGDARAARGEGL